MVKQHNQVMLTLLVLSDLAAAAAGWGVSCYLHYGLDLFNRSPDPAPGRADLAFVFVLSLGAVPLFFGGLGLYDSKRTKSLMGESGGIVRAVVAVWATTYVIVSLLKPDGLSKPLMLFVLADWLILAIATRLAVRGMLRRFRSRGWNLRHAAIVGSSRLSQKLYHVLGRNKWTGIQVEYFVADANSQPKLLGLDVFSPAAEIDDIVMAHPVDIVFVALPADRHDETERVLNRLTMTNADVRVVPDLLSFHYLRHDVTQLDELPIINLTHSPQHGYGSIVKRAFDVIASLTGLILLAAPMAFIAILVKCTSSGPALYRQKRASLGGRPFDIIKFRTMGVDAEDSTGPLWARSDDPRATRVGRILRRTSLDELPQLFNVLLGHMSMVGPRPERPEFIAGFRKQVPRYMLRNQVKAGLTGWAQIHGLRGRTSLEKRIQYDLYYISNWSLALDLWILILSPLRALTHPNAY
ncbi:MAG: undecaprenyl-phosphate glucose phosphotransferase [Planctomycetes bacterium]|nr:undecaprenyl-phosphate glucose phosphotransferase [Planctomycetota bacterium]